MPTATVIKSASDSELKKLLSDKTYTDIPKKGDIVKGIIISLSPREILIDLPGFKSGIVRGMEAREVRNAYPDLKAGNEIESTVTELENEEGQVELSLRFAGQTRAWENALETKSKMTIVEGKVTDANRGGLMITWKGMKGFMPVSQLSPEHYPRVPGGDKGKILERLRSFVGQTMRLNVIDVDSNQDKLIFSEKSLWEDEQKDLISKYKPGDIVEGKITAIADFGVFVRFSAAHPRSAGQTGSAADGDGLEGLVHISEIAWQRIDNPADFLKIGQEVRAKVLNIQGSKIFLSIRALQEDPWKRVHEHYSVGQKVQGKVLKLNPFGLFVELDAEIHGLAHVSELDIKPSVAIEEQIKPGDTRTFQIVSIEPEHHRLGLSEKALRSEEAATLPEPPAENAAGADTPPAATEVSTPAQENPDGEDSAAVV